MKTLVNIDVPDLQAAIDFYSAALDLKLVRIIDEDVAELEGASCLIYLLRQPAMTRPVPSPEAKRDYGRHWTPVHLDFVVGDLGSAAARALRAGARQEGPARHWRGLTHVTCSDPFGHGFCLVAFEGETYVSD